MSILSAIPKALQEVQELGERLEGGHYIVFLLWLFGAILVRFEWKETLSLIGIVIPITFVLYRLGSSMDDLLFDPIFKPETDHRWGFGWLGLAMRGARRNAACLMETGQRDCTSNHHEVQNHKPNMDGIYRRSEALYRGTIEWEQQVHWRIKLSKAARCFIIPTALIFIYDCWPSFLPRLTPSNNLFGVFAFLSSVWAQWMSLLLSLSVTVTYVVLRLGHMKALYELVSNNASFKPIPLRLRNIGPEETLTAPGCLYFIGRSEVRRIAHPRGRCRYSTALLLRGAKYQRHLLRR